MKDLSEAWIERKPVCECGESVNARVGCVRPHPKRGPPRVRGVLGIGPPNLMGEDVSMESWCGVIGTGTQPRCSPEFPTPFIFPVTHQLLRGLSEGLMLGEVDDLLADAVCDTEN